MMLLVIKCKKVSEGSSGAQEMRREDHEFEVGLGY